MSSLALLLLFQFGAKPPTPWVWIKPAEIQQLPTSGPAWSAVLADAIALGPINLADQNERDDSRAMAAAMVWRRVGGESMRAGVQAQLLASMGTEDASGDALAISRNLCACVIAAQLITWAPASDEEVYRAWLSAVRYKLMRDGRSLVSVHEDRPNNWGTHAGASRMAADVYLGDLADLDAARIVFKGWLGDRGAYCAFDYGGVCWQADALAPVGINPPGADLSGVLPDDQRRSGLCPPTVTQEGYVWEAMQGAVTQAVILRRRGFDSFAWSDSALRRALDWLHNVAAFPADGDDRWIPWIANDVYGTSYPAHTPTTPGKSVGYSDWTAQARTWP